MVKVTIELTEPDALEVKTILEYDPQDSDADIVYICSKVDSITSGGQGVFIDDLIQAVEALKAAREAVYDKSYKAV